MRTLFTTDGKVEGAALKDIKKCFLEAHKSGFWLDIEAPEEDAG